MDNSPGGNEIEYLKGNGDKILDRGKDIRRLGRQMISSAALLKSIADGASGQRGLAVDELQDVVGDCHEELKLAGERYKPSGDALVTYGQAVIDLKPLIKTAVDNCEAEWKVVVSKRSAVSSVPFYTLPEPGETPPAADAEAPNIFEERQEAIKEAQGEADKAYEDWAAEARIFDTHYDTWEAAFLLAAEELDDATKGGIKDSKWDDLDGLVAGVLEVLTWVGLGLAILGLIIGGPFIAALAAIVAIATLLLTLYSFSRGNSTWGDLAFAVIGVIPFGSLGKLKANKLDFLHDMVGGIGKGEIVAELGRVGHGITTGFGRAGGFFPGLARGARGGMLAWAGPNGMGGMNVLSRLMTGQNMRHWGNDALAAPSILGSIWGDSLVKTAFGVPDAISELTTGDSLHNNWFPSPTLDAPLFGSPTR